MCKLETKMNRKKLISLSQNEIMGYGDEFISINVTKFKKYFFCVLGKSCDGDNNKRGQIYFH